MAEEQLPVCPTCGIGLLVDAPINVITRWQEIISRFRRVAMGEGWENLSLEGAVRLDTAEDAECDVAYVGDLITPKLECPRCHASIYEALVAEPQAKTQHSASSTYIAPDPQEE